VSDHAPFLAACQTHMNDPGPFAVYADWCAERGHFWSEQALRARAWYLSGLAKADSFSLVGCHWYYQWQPALFESAAAGHWDISICPSQLFGTVNLRWTSEYNEWWTTAALQIVTAKHPATPWNNCGGRRRPRHTTPSDMGWTADPPFVIAPYLKVFFAKLLKSKAVKSKPKIDPFQPRRKTA
jgi:hypothetical protein